ncbi:MAG: hypothetical protein CL741_04350 [Chloroflexi bacterium]|nr:hypothetical protein [Chloroflexota bacterium]
MNKTLDNKTINKVCNPLPTAEDSADNLSKCMSSSLFLLEFLIEEGVAITLVPKELSVKVIRKNPIRGIKKSNIDNKELNKIYSKYHIRDKNSCFHTRMRGFLFFNIFFSF